MILEQKTQQGEERVINLESADVGMKSDWEELVCESMNKKTVVMIGGRTLLRNQVLPKVQMKEIDDLRRIYK